MKKFKTAVPASMVSPEKLPSDEQEHDDWQRANREFWEQMPMRYDWKDNLAPEEFSREFYEEIDRRFFGAVSQYMPWDKTPFDNLIKFSDLSDKRVLEIGVGNGSHAALLASHAADFTGIDLTDYAVTSTNHRFEHFALSGTVQQMDAEQMAFKDDQFDYIWSWGVIHHSANTADILENMYRVLKPGGRVTTMVYNRGWWNYYFCGGVLLGLLRGQLFRTRSIAKTIQQNTDGVIARHYTKDSWQRLLQDKGFVVDRQFITGAKTDVLVIPDSQVKRKLLGYFPNGLGRFMTRSLGMGNFLISEFHKPGMNNRTVVN